MGCMLPAHDLAEVEGAADAVVDDEIVLPAIGADLLGAVAAADHRLALFIALRLGLRLLQFVEAGAQQLPCLLAVLRLALRVLHAHFHAGWFVDQVHRGRDLVDILAAGAGRGRDPLLHVGGVQFDFDFLGLGQHRDGGGRRVHASLGFGCRHAFDLVRAALVAKLGPDAFAADREDRQLAAAVVGVGPIEVGDLPAVLGGEAAVHLDEVGAERGRHLDLLVRVPPTLYDCARIGLDVERWIKDGLVDVVAAGGGFIPFEQPIREFVEAAAGTDCQILGSFEALRWALDEDVLRALATRFWGAGVDGFYLFNYFNAPNEWKRRVLGEMVDRERLPRLNKRYELDHTDRVESKHGHVGAFRYAIPNAQLPVHLEETLPDGGSVLQMDVADDAKDATSVQLGLGFDGILDDDEIEVRINGRPIAWDTRRVSDDGWSHHIFDGDVYHTTMSLETVEGTLIELDVADICGAKRGQRTNGPADRRAVSSSKARGPQRGTAVDPL